MKRLDLDEILSGEELVEPIVEKSRPKVKIQQINNDCETGKLSYPTASDAAKAASFMKHKKHKGGSWYRCEFCGAYHLTSIKKGKRRKGKMRM